MKKVILALLLCLALPCSALAASADGVGEGVPPRRRIIAAGIALRTFPPWAVAGRPDPGHQDRVGPCVARSGVSAFYPDATSGLRYHERFAYVDRVASFFASKLK